MMKEDGSGDLLELWVEDLLSFLFTPPPLGLASAEIEFTDDSLHVLPKAPFYRKPQPAL